MSKKGSNNPTSWLSSSNSVEAAGPNGHMKKHEQGFGLEGFEPGEIGVRELFDGNHPRMGAWLERNMICSSVRFGEMA